MQIIEWSSDFALGIAEIDDQHRALVGMINALDASTHADYSAEGMRKMLDELNAYVRDHFAFEERLMAGGGCTQELVTRHTAEHAYFRSVLRDLTADFERGYAGITVTLIEYLVHWLLHHIVVVDRAMSQQLNAADPELAARVAAALATTMVDDLTDSERHLLNELRRANEQLERLVHERTKALNERNGKLEAELGEARAEVQRLRLQLAGRGVAG
ncbi:bacteriohemerythrin [Sulfuritalea sp.]|uniref:bacteriohemerythrin n=1 Tax=Sulfuritalea sp. TaxID=2480090 RepID=UPI001AC63C07|nr:bacteriohemerythrin [Sulfuritalea sp.]MBN8474331.1 bacteriohemerythrin [Sulfuritalea sp.]